MAEIGRLSRHIESSETMWNRETWNPLGFGGADLGKTGVFFADLFWGQVNSARHSSSARRGKFVSNGGGFSMGQIGNDSCFFFLNMWHPKMGQSMTSQIVVMFCPIVFPWWLVWKYIPYFYVCSITNNIYIQRLSSWMIEYATANFRW